MTSSAGPGDLGQSQVLAALHGDAAAYYGACLSRRGSGPDAARELLCARAVSGAAAAAYQLGYAPAGWTAVTDHLRGLGYSDDSLHASGLSLVARHGRLVDRFRDRVMFPVHDSAGGDVVGFLGRLVPPRQSASRGGGSPARAHNEHAAPKYLNSPHTAVYRKAELLYGLGAAPVRQALAVGARPVLVEGPLDAIAVTSAGAAGTHGTARYVGVAPCGTALTAQQVATLEAQAGPLRAVGVTAAFDHDLAGRQASVRAFPLLRAVGAWPTCAALPPGLDPADVLAAEGAAALAGALSAGKPLADLVVDEQIAPWTHQLQWAEGRLAAVRAAARVLATLPADEVGRQVHRVAVRVGAEHVDVTTAVLEAVSSGLDHPDRHTLSGAGIGSTDPPAVVARAGLGYPLPLAQPLAARPHSAGTAAVVPVERFRVRPSTASRAGAPPTTRPTQPAPRH